MNTIHLKSGNKYHHFPSFGGAKGWVIKKDIYFLILKILQLHAII